MSEYTYEPPTNDVFKNSVIRKLRENGQSFLLEVVTNSKVTISSTSIYSKQRWDAYATLVYCEVEPAYYDKNEAELEKPEWSQSLVQYCDDAMPEIVGFDITRVILSRKVPANRDTDVLDEALANIENLGNIVGKHIPQDVGVKGREMSEVYYYLYVIENFMRIFIESRFLESGTTPSIPKAIADKVTGRKTEERKKQWIGMRGTSDFFYMDFDELRQIIANNWPVFKSSFEDEQWITMKLKDLATIRNRVAHNSYVEEHERNVILTNFESIIRQLRNHD